MAQPLKSMHFKANEWILLMFCMQINIGVLALGAMNKFAYIRQSIDS